MFKKLSRIVPLSLVLFALALSGSAANAQDPVQPPVITVQDLPVSQAIIDKALADQLKTGYGPVDYSKVDYSPDAPAFEGLYPIDPHTWIQAECGGKYVDEECWLRPGVPVPPNVVFTAVDKDGNYTFRGIHPPTEAEMRALMKPAQ